MSENEFEFCGDAYTAIEVALQNGCNGCAMWTQSRGCAANLFTEVAIPDCDPGYRADGRNVIFVEVQDERAKR